MISPPDWLSKMANEVASEIYGTDLLAPLGCHYYLNRALQQWEVTLFASNTEIVGGKKDGHHCPSNFRVNLKNLSRIFEQIDNFHWQALSLGREDDLGPHIAVEGTYEDHSIWLRILAYPPERFESGRYALAYDLRLEDMW